MLAIQKKMDLNDIIEFKFLINEAKIKFRLEALQYKLRLLTEKEKKIKRKK